MSNVDHTTSKALLADIIATKERNLLASVDVLKEQLLAQFRERAAVLEADAEATLVKNAATTSSAITTAANNEAQKEAEVTDSGSDAQQQHLTHADLIHLLIPFTDFTNKLTTKLGNAYLPRELLFDMCNIVAQHCAAHFNPPSASSSAAASSSSASSTIPMPERYRTAKNKFDLICNYSKRKEEQIPNTGTFYDYDLCVYLMSKTFKKSATDAYESFFSLGGSTDAATTIGGDGASSSSSFPLLRTLRSTKDLYLGSIGGGPGSDMTGMVAYFYDLLTSGSYSTTGSNKDQQQQKDPLGDITFHLQVFDIMDVNWCASSRKPLSKGFMKYLGGGNGSNGKKHIEEFADAHNHEGCETNAEPSSTSTAACSSSAADGNKVCVQYKHIDLKEPSTVLPVIEDLRKLHFISCCWALNEALFVPEFWTLVLANTPKAHIIIVEGKDDKLDLVRDMCMLPEISRAVHYDKYESPRRLIVKPKAE